MATASEVSKITTILADKGVGFSVKASTLLGLFTSAPIVLPTVTPTADGAANMEKCLFLINSGIDVTGFTPAYVGQLVVIWCLGSGTDPTVTCGAGVTINATGNNKMTFPDADDAMVMVAASVTRWNIILNIGSVTLSSV